MTPDKLIVPALTLTNAATNLEHQVKALQGKRVLPAHVERMQAEAAIVRRHLDEIDAQLAEAKQ